MKSLRLGTLSELDLEMSAILKNPRLSTKEKVEKYNEVLQRNLIFENDEEDDEEEEEGDDADLIRMNKRILREAHPIWESTPRKFNREKKTKTLKRKEEKEEKIN